MILKCLVILGVMNVLPPPGGPIAQNNMISSSFMNDNALRSYQP